MKQVAFFKKILSLIILATMGLSTIIPLQAITKEEAAQLLYKKIHGEIITIEQSEAINEALTTSEKETLVNEYLQKLITAKNEGTLTNEQINGIKNYLTPFIKIQVLGGTTSTIINQSITTFFSSTEVTNIKQQAIDEKKTNELKMLQEEAKELIKDQVYGEELTKEELDLINKAFPKKEDQTAIRKKYEDEKAAEQAKLQKQILTGTITSAPLDNFPNKHIAIKLVNSNKYFGTTYSKKLKSYYLTTNYKSPQSFKVLRKKNYIGLKSTNAKNHNLQAIKKTKRNPKAPVKNEVRFATTNFGKAEQWKLQKINNNYLLKSRAGNGYLTASQLETVWRNPRVKFSKKDTTIPNALFQFISFPAYNTVQEKLWGTSTLTPTGPASIREGTIDPFVLATVAALITTDIAIVGIGLGITPVKIINFFSKFIRSGLENPGPYPPYSTFTSSIATGDYFIKNDDWTFKNRKKIDRLIQVTRNVPIKLPLKKPTKNSLFSIEVLSDYNIGLNDLLQIAYKKTKKLVNIKDLNSNKYLRAKIVDGKWRIVADITNPANYPECNFKIPLINQGGEYWIGLVIVKGRKANNKLDTFKKSRKMFISSKDNFIRFSKSKYKKSKTMHWELNGKSLDDCFFLSRTAPNTYLKVGNNRIIGFTKGKNNASRFAIEFAK